MSGLLDAILGGSPDQTPDANGMTNADRSQLGFNSLANMGAILMAAGQPMQGNERARYLAMLGQVPGQMVEQRAQIAQTKRQKAQLEAQQRQNDAAKSVQELAKDPNVLAGLPPAAQTLIKASLMKGDVAGVSEVLKMSRPQSMGGGMVYDPQTNSVVNPILQTRMPLDGSGTQSMGGPGQTASDEVDPQTGNREQWLATQPKMLQDRLRGVANGDLPLPSAGSRDPIAQQVNNLIYHYSPGYKAQDYTAKQQFLSNVTQGQIFQKVIAPAQKMINHAENFLKTYEGLGMKDGEGDMATGLLAKAQNEASYYKSLLSGDGKAKGAEQALKSFKDEFTKFMRGTGGMTDQAERLQNNLSAASTPSEVKAVIGQMVELMNGQLEPITAQYRISMKKPSATASDLLGDHSRTAMQNVENWGPKPKGQAPTQGGDKPPMEGARKAPDGKWYVQKDGKYFEVR